MLEQNEDDDVERVGKDALMIAVLMFREVAEDVPAVEVICC